MSRVGLPVERTEVIHVVGATLGLRHRIVIALPAVRRVSVAALRLFNQVSVGIIRPLSSYPEQSGWPCPSPNKLVFSNVEQSTEEPSHHSPHLVATHLHKTIIARKADIRSGLKIVPYPFTKSRSGHRCPQGLTESDLALLGAADTRKQLMRVSEPLRPLSVSHPLPSVHRPFAFH